MSWTTEIPAEAAQPLPQPSPPVSLLTSTADGVANGALPDIEIENGRATRGWLGGVRWNAQGCRPIHVWEAWDGCAPCDGEPNVANAADYCDPTGPEEQEAWPFDVYVTNDCGGPHALRDLVGEGRQALEAQSSLQMARHLHMGSQLAAGGPRMCDPTPSLQGCAASLTTPGENALDPAAAIGLLLANREHVLGQPFSVLHIPTIAVPLLVENGVIALQGSRYIGPMGLPVVVGPGYPTTGPAAYTGDTAAPAGTAWFYVSGPIDWALQPIETVQVMDFDEARRNENSSLAIRRALVRVDCCGIYAVLASLGGTTTEAPA